MTNQMVNEGQDIHTCHFARTDTGAYQRGPGRVLGRTSGTIPYEKCGISAASSCSLRPDGQGLFEEDSDGHADQGDAQPASPDDQCRGGGRAAWREPIGGVSRRSSRPAQDVPAWPQAAGPHRSPAEVARTMRGGTRKRGETWTWFFDAVDPVTGKRRQRSKGGFRTKREAQAALSEALAAYRAPGRWSTRPGSRSAPSWTSSSRRWSATSSRTRTRSTATTPAPTSSRILGTSD